MKKTLNTDFESTPYDWWQIKLFQVIKDSHPYMLSPDNELETMQFIVLRAKAAKAFYEQMLQEGIDHLLAQEEAYEEVLIGDLKYSPTNFIAEIAYDEKSVDLTDQKLIEIYAKVKHLFKDRAYMDEHPEAEDDIAEEIKKVLNIVL